MNERESLSFSIFGAPKTTAQQKGVMVRGKRVMFFKKKKVADEESRITIGCLPHRVLYPFEGPLMVEVTFVFPLTQADEKKWKIGRDGTIPKTTRPDVDNCQKTLLDVMTKQGFWHDDSQISTLILRKVSGFTPAIHVKIAELT